MQPYHDITQPAVAKALAHPLRTRILAALEGRAASPSSLADELDAPISVVAYHVRRLHQLGFVELVEQVQKRGAVEHYYTATSRPLITDAAWGALPGVVKEAAVSAALQQIGSYVNAAAATGGFDAGDIHLTRSPVTVDGEGWKELRRKLDALTVDIQRIETESRSRLAQADHEGEQEATVVLMLFHSPPAGAPARVSPKSHPADEDASPSASEHAAARAPGPPPAGRVDATAERPITIPEPTEPSPLRAQTLAAHRAYWQDGLSLREIGALLGITAERVRQRFYAAGLPTRSSAEARRFRARMRGADTSAREERACAVLRAAYEESGEQPLTRTAYEMTRRRRHRDWPSSETLVRALGGAGWAAALAAAGLPPVERKRSTPEEEAAKAARWARARALSAEGLSAPEIAERLGRESGVTAAEIARAVRRARISELWAQGLTGAEIAKELGLSTGVVNAEINRMRLDGEDLPFRRAPRRQPAPTAADRAADEPPRPA